MTLTHSMNEGCPIQFVWFLNLGFVPLEELNHVQVAILDSHNKGCDFVEAGIQVFVDISSIFKQDLNNILFKGKRTNLQNLWAQF